MEALQIEARILKEKARESGFSPGKCVVQRVQ
jgi:hypothetical protein